MAIPKEFADILTGKNTNLRLSVVTDESGRQMVTAINSDGEAIGDMMPLDEVVGQGMPNPYGGTSPASTITYNEQTGEFGDSQNQDVTQFLSTNYPGMGLVHQNLGTDRFIDPSKVYDTPYGRVTSQDNVKAGESSMLEGMINPVSLFALAMGIPTLPGGGSGLSSLADLVTGGSAAGGAGGATSLLDPSLITSPVAPVSTGSAFGTVDPFLQGVTQTMPATLGASVPAGSTLGTAAPFTSGLGAATGAAAIPGLSEAIQQAATQAGGAAGSGLASAAGGVAPAAGAAAGSGAGLGLGSAATTAALGGAASGLGTPSTPPATMPNPGPPAATASEIAGTTAPAATGSSLSQYLQGLGMPAGIADLITPQSIGAVGSSLLGVLGSRDQANAYRDTANQFLNMGAPYRDRLASLYANPESYTSGPEMQGVMKAFNQSLSAQYGNPYMSPTATAQSVAYGLGALGKEKDRLAGYGGLGFNPSSMAGLSAQGNSNSGTYNALGAGLAQLTQPQNTMTNTMEDLLRAQTRRLNTGMGL